MHPAKRSCCSSWTLVICTAGLTSVFTVQWHLLYIYVCTLARAFADVSDPGRLHMEFCFRLSRKKEAVRLLVVVLTVTLFFRICECLVPYFDSSSSDSRNGLFSGSWLHPVDSLYISWLVFGFTFTAWALHLNDDTVTVEVLFGATVLYVVVSWLVLPLGLVDHVAICHLKHFRAKGPLNMFLLGFLMFGQWSLNLRLLECQGYIWLICIYVI